MTNCCCKKPTAEQAKIIEEMLVALYPVTVSSIAGRLGVTDLEAAELLPEANCTFVKGDITERFTEISAELASWEKITLFIQHEGSIFEIQGQLHEGKIAQGYYNILAKSAKIGGHMKYDVFSAVAFTTFPFMELPVSRRAVLYQGRQNGLLGFRRSRKSSARRIREGKVHCRPSQVLGLIHPF